MPHRTFRRQALPRKRSNRDLFAALASGFVATLALASSVYNVYLQRQQVRAQVLPTMEWGVHWESDDAWTFVVSNRGVGPANVKRMRVFVDGKPEATWLAAEKALLPGRNATIGTTHPIVSTMSPGQQAEAFRIGDKGLAVGMFLERRRLAVELCYCSTLDDCWIAAGRGVRSDPPTPVAACTPDAVPFQPLDEGAVDDLVKSMMSDAGASTGD
jgi:hypothetical protein